MAGNRSSAEYGVPYVDQESVSNPETQMAANRFNRLGEDAAQMTRMATKVDVVFTTSAAAAPATITPTTGSTQWGTGSSYLPTVQKTATGTYVITWATSYADALVGTVADAVGETETVSLTRARAEVMFNNSGIVRAVPSGRTVTVYTKTTGGVADDFGGLASIWVEAR